MGSRLLTPCKNLYLRVVKDRLITKTLVTGGATNTVESKEMIQLSLSGGTGNVILNQLSLHTFITVIVLKQLSVLFQHHIRRFLHRETN